MRLIHTPGPLTRVAVAAAVLAGCGDGGSGGPTGPTATDNVAPTVAAIPDQAVIRNTLTPRAVDVEVRITDPDDAVFTVSVATDAPGVVPAMSGVACGADPCTITLTPSPAADTVVAVTVTVDDGGGGRASTSFALRVTSLRVTSASTDGPGSLRAAVTGAEAGDVVGFEPAGAFGSATTIALSAPIVIDRDLTLEGPGAARLTVSGSSAVRVFEVAGPADVVLRGLTIADGVAPDQRIETPAGALGGRYGGGILAGEGSELTLEAVVVSANTAVDGGGGGIAAVGATTTIRDTEVVGNQAGVGGGVFVHEGVLLMDRPMVSGNRAEAGGGLFVRGTVAMREGTEFAGNTATGAQGVAGGGAMYIEHGSVATLTGVRIDGNDATWNGGGVMAQGTVAVTASSLSGNTSGHDGGGIWYHGAALTVTGSTFDDNEAMTGGGLYYGATGGGTGIVDASEFVSNRAAGCGGGLAARSTTGDTTGRALVLRGGTRIAFNTAKQGGGVCQFSVPMTLDSAALEDNAASVGGFNEDAVGGGIMSDASLEVSNHSSIERNVAFFGGGVYTESDFHLSASSVIVANEARSHGGGIAVNRGSVTVLGTFCMILGNQAGTRGSGFGGGIASFVSDISGVPASRVCLNTPDDIAES